VEFLGRLSVLLLALAQGFLACPCEFFREPCGRHQRLPHAAFDYVVHAVCFAHDQGSPS
jgi:hypothetical protein